MVLLFSVTVQHNSVMQLCMMSVCLQIDSVMSTRQANENDASRRLKSEFLIQFDGVTSNPNDLVIVIGKLYISNSIKVPRTGRDVLFISTLCLVSMTILASLLQECQLVYYHSYL